MAKNWHSTVWNKNIEDIMSDSFGKYAKYIIQDRALPDVRDGLKPVQRRILYAMNDLNLLHDKPYKKSARTVGEVIGKYHPHGDLSIYEAMVRMSQDWKSNAPLLDMHGNNGSIDGDSAAAMRYTESRLSLFGETLLNDIKKDTVDFIPNFDDSEKEPTVLPTLLPNLLINGSSGIAAGYATNIPPFNVQEVIDAVILKIDSPNCQLGSILKVMPGPDFPTGGTILNQDGIVEAYKTGRGKIIVRGDIKEEKKQLIITSIPFETSKAAIVKAIDEIRIKNENMGILEVRDESSKEGLSIAIDLKAGANVELIKKFLYKNTQLQISYNFNMVAIINNKPVLMPMDLILEAFVNHLQTIIIRASQFDLNKTKKRLNIVRGLIKAISILDDVIETIRFSTGKNEAKTNLIEKYAFNEEQAEAIVNLRLYRLSLTDVKQFREEANQLEEDIIKLETLIENAAARNNHIKAKLRELKKTFKSERKTKFSNDEAKIEINVNDMIENKEEMVLVTKDGYIKTISNKNYMSQQYQDLKLKELDLPVAQFIANKRDKLILVTNRGNYIVIPCHKVNNTKWKEIGIHYNNIISAHTNEEIINAFAYNANTAPKQLLLATNNGNIKRININDLNVASSAKISTCMSLTSENDKLITCEMINNEEDSVIVVSNNGYSLSYPLKAIPLVSRKAQGVKAFNIKSDDKLVGAIINNNDIDLIALIGPNGGKRIKKTYIKKAMTRNSVGSLLINQTKHNTIKVHSVFEARVSDLFNLIDESKQWSIIKSTTIPMGDDNSRLSNFWKYQILSTSKCYLKGREEVVSENNQEDVKPLFE